MTWISKVISRCLFVLNDLRWLFVFLTFVELLTITVKLSFFVFMFDKGDFESYRQQLSLVDWDSLLVRDDIDISTSNITRALIDAANTHIPNRVITVRKDNHPWL